MICCGFKRRDVIRSKARRCIPFRHFAQAALLTIHYLLSHMSEINPQGQSSYPGPAQSVADFVESLQNNEEVQQAEAEIERALLGKLRECLFNLLLRLLGLLGR